MKSPPPFTAAREETSRCWPQVFDKLLKICYSFPLRATPLLASTGSTNLISMRIIYLPSIGRIAA
jgi:hypothetical protein